MVSKRILSAVNGLIMMAGVLLLAGVFLISCTEDDPVNPVNNHRPNGENGIDDGNGNGNGGNGNNGGSTTGNGSGDDRTESELRIVGEWLRTDGMEKLNMGLDGSYIAYSCTEKGREWVIYATGHYVYHDLANSLWVEIYGENEDFSAVYRTVFEGKDNLTLWSADNKKRSFTRI